MPARYTSRRILVPLDGSALDRAAIPHLRALATVQSEILLHRVLPGRRATLGKPGEVTRLEHRRAEEFARSDAQLREIAEALSDITPRIARLTSTGTPAEEILRVASERGTDMILMATHGFGTPAHPRDDSVTSQVAERATVPVMMLSPRDDEALPTHNGCARYGRVIVPLDGSDRALAALPVAAALASSQNRPIRLMRSIPDYDEGTTKHAAYHDFAGRRADLLDALASDARTLPPEIVRQTAVLIGAPERAILDEIRAGDIIVIASQGEGGADPGRLGSVAREIIEIASAPVVLVPVDERQSVPSALRRPA